MELRQLNHLLAIHETGSFAKAAGKLRITQPALTLSIAKLEAELGAKLLERGRMGATVTAAGQAVVLRAKLAWAELRLATLEVQGLSRSDGGNVRVGVGALFAQKIAPMAIAAFNARHPLVNIITQEGTSAELFPRLIAGDLDMVASTPLNVETDLSELVQEVLFETHDVLVVRAHHPVTTQSQKPSIEQLAKYPWAISAQCREMQKQVFALFADAGLTTLPTIVRTDGVPLIRHLLMKEDYVGVISSELGPFEIQADSLSVVPVANLNLTRKAAISYRRRSKLSPAAERFRRELRRHCRSIGRT